MSHAELFHVPENPYFLSHSVGCLPKSSEQFLTENLMTPWKESGGDAWGDWLGVVDGFCLSLSKLLGGQASDFCPQTNLSSGFTKFLQALPKTDPKRNRIIMDADAFPSMGFVVKGLERLGFELVLLEHHATQSQLQAWQNHLDERVLCALITHVHSNTGQVSDVTAITQICSQQGVFSVVDIAQSAGILAIYLPKWNADIVLGSCVKWLCGGSGAGFIWANPKLINSLKPVDVGWFSHQNPFEWDIRNFDYADSAKRFWGGTPSVAPYALAQNGINTILEIGVAKVFEHNRELAKPVVQAFEHGLLTPIDLLQTGGTLCLQLDEDSLTTLKKKLSDQACHYDTRGNTVRLSFHIYNGKRDLDALLG